MKKIVANGGMLVLFLATAACGDLGGSGQCGGAELTGTCLRIEKIQSESGNDDKKTSNIDAFITRCSDGKPEDKGAASFDHSAVITFSNRPLPGVLATDVSDVTLESFSISYSLNSCPGTCPDIATYTAVPGETIRIPVNSSIDAKLPFFSIQQKIDYEATGGRPDTYPSYTATYTVTGTDSFQNPVSVKGSSEFTIGDYLTGTCATT